ncbi:MAG: hypothetical protein JWO09_1987 [Bacteroidetes bacterium]|nr:hypothetical protein [Bacteroidota bacterium]
MYPLRKSDTGYSFTTQSNVKYEIFFTLLPEELHPLLIRDHVSNYFYFGIERLTDKAGVIDPFIRRTIVFTIVSFFLENEGAVLVFNYSSTEGKLEARRRLFHAWFEEFRTHTVYQFHQHDFSDFATVCALYKRSGGVKFESIKSSIHKSLENLNSVKD